ncbi:MAG: RNA polymerase factor sigma-54, partial [Verrucomicrobiota bacterium]
LSDADTDVIVGGDEIIGNLDEKGFLKVPLEEIAMSAQVPYDKVLQALELIQTFEPAGIAARSLPECLLIQLKRLHKENEIEGQIVKDHLDDLGHKRYPQIAKALKIPAERVVEASQVIGQLNPRPGAAFASDEKQNIVVPEIVIRKEEEGWQILINDEVIPKLKIKDEYKDLLGSTGEDRGLRDYLKEKIRSGKFLIKCLQQRQQTLNAISQEVLKRQMEFFEQGVAHLKPLTMNQVAEVVGVHETTVSRAVSGKYVVTPHGVFEMKYFFTTGYQGEDGQFISNTSVKDKIKEIIARENLSKPFSDEEIAKILSEQGVQVARRTVVKYRTALGILPSHLRKQTSV